jgi:3-hydroxy-9,10-secoandrosta-1,3,5(10)-triene-9,17-dione monooxygenase
MAGGSPTRSAESAPGQLRLAEAAAEVAAARALHQSNVREILGRAEQRAAFTPLDRARYQRDKAFAVKLSVQAVNRLFDASGGRATALDEPIQRYHRDINAASHHGSLVWDLAAEEYGRQALGLEPKFPR